MAERPILFSGPMVNANLEGRKTNTRRVLKPQPYPNIRELKRVGREAKTGRLIVDGVTDRGEITGSVFPKGKYFTDNTCPTTYAVGDVLWVREAWRTSAAYDDLKPSEMGGEEPIFYEADGAVQTWGWKVDSPKGRARPGIFMPRWASRLLLRVTDVRVERLQDISDEDALEEGILEAETDDGDILYSGTHWTYPVPAEHLHHYATDAFRALWDSINAKRGFGWLDNPWVIVIAYERNSDG